tara:strand:- start:22465 stop:22695 length:231 start_codon:yes stop_codon:yes gene_type:complete
MTKQDLKKIIVEKAKAKGLDIAEDAVQDLQDLAFEIVGEIVAMTPNTYDDMIWTAVKGKADEVLDGLIDKIDGQEN